MVPMQMPSLLYKSFWYVPDGLQLVLADHGDHAVLVHPVALDKKALLVKTGPRVIAALIFTLKMRINYTYSRRKYCIFY